MAGPARYRIDDQSPHRHHWWGARRAELGPESALATESARESFGTVAGVEIAIAAVGAAVLAVRNQARWTGALVGAGAGAVHWLYAVRGGLAVALSG